MDIRKILLEPPMLQVNFQDPTWAARRETVWALIGVAIASDLVAQFLVGDPSFFTVALSLLSIGLGFLPARLALAFAGLYISQSLGSIVMITGLVLLGLPKAAVVLLASFWQLWCFVAMASLFLRYVRTPRVH